MKGEFFCDLCSVSANNEEMFQLHLNGAKHQSKMKRLNPKVESDEPKVMMDGTIMIGDRPVSIPTRGRGGRGRGRGGFGGRGGRGGGGGGK